MEIFIDLDKKSYSFSGNIGSYFVETYLTFIGNSVSSFENFNFKYFLYENNTQKFSDFSNSENTYIVKIPSGVNEKRFVFHVVDLLPDTNYVFNIEVFDNEDFISDFNISFTTEIPSSPFESWIWDQENLTWNPPIPLPDKENNYEWVEDTQEWFLIPESPYDSWEWNSLTLSWQAPVPYPAIDDNENYFWDEETFSWVLTEENS